MLFPIISITCSHLFYALVWLRPDLVKRGDQIIKISVGLRTIQFITMAAMMYNYSIQLTYFKSKLLVIIAGQLLNMSVYHKLGLEGVYYGSRFKKLPMVTSFPYNMVNNPQYIGCILTQYGIVLFYPYNEMAIITTYSIMWYMATIQIEKIPMLKQV